jgi:hypothetical protein
MGLTHEHFWSMSWGEFWNAYWGYWLRLDRVWLHTRTLASYLVAGYMTDPPEPEEIRLTLHDDPEEETILPANRVMLTKEEDNFFKQFLPKK